jgi:hypothetical protein
MEHSPHIEKLIPGSSEGSVEALVWSKGRLFSTGLHGFVVEYNLVELSPKASYAVTSGSAWCLAVSKAHTHLAVNLFTQLKEYKDFHFYVRRLDLKKDTSAYLKSLKKD